MTALIGLAPTRSWEIGELIGNGRSGRLHDNAGWVRERVLNDLQDTCSLRVRCYGTSDSEQGGFWLGRETVQCLDSLGVEFFCTIYRGQAAHDDSIENN